LARWLEAYIVITAALATIAAFGYGFVLTVYFWYVCFGFVFGALVLILLHRHFLKRQVASRDDTVRRVSDELLTILERHGGRANPSTLKKELQGSCRPYFDKAILFLKREGFLDGTSSTR
jgi:hypothetical protein